MLVQINRSIKTQLERLTITALSHKSRNDTMERAMQVPLAGFFLLAKFDEVISGLRNDISEHLHGDTPGRTSTDSHIEVHTRICHCGRIGIGLV